MSDDFQIDARKWHFLNDADRYIERATVEFQREPLKRQFKTAKEILTRLSDGRGVLLADDAGLGKTLVAALVAWVVACQNKRVRIYAPNDVMRRRWAEELERHIPMLEQIGASHDRIKHGDVDKLNAGRIQVATHHTLVENHNKNKQRTACDLMIIDEAHRAKGEDSDFSKALRNLGGRAKRKLILTATPFSIRITELEQLLRFVGATKFKAVRQYADALERIYGLDDGHDPTAESARLVGAAKAAIDAIQPYLIRHGIDGLLKPERQNFGVVGSEHDRWVIPTPAVSDDALEFLLRMDRILQLTSEHKGERRNDPRFHIGWEYAGARLGQAAERADTQTGHAARRHIEEAQKSLAILRAAPHPKIAAVIQAIRPLLDAGEKVLVFCHHRATSGELLGALEQSLKVESISCSGPPEDVWRAAWTAVLSGDTLPGQLENKPLLNLIIDWLCRPGLRWQVGGWLGQPAGSAKALASQLSKTRPRHAPARAPTIGEAAHKLAEKLLDADSKSTLAVLRNIRRQAFGRASHFPGHLDEGFRVMGAWIPDGHGQQPNTLYTGQPDIVLSIFNSPFGPDVLVATDRLSEGVDLHRYCRHLIHYELDPSPVRTLQRNGRVRRIGSWAALTQRPILYAYPTFGGTRDEKAVGIMKQRITAFGLLLGGVPALDDGLSDNDGFVEKVLEHARKPLESLNKKLRA